MSTAERRHRFWPEKKRKKKAAYDRVYYSENSGRYINRARVRREQIVPQATLPGYLDRIEGFYREARRLTEETGIPHVVDHVWPLNGKNSCGLHVPWNLQVITQSENDSKSNKDPEQPRILDGGAVAW